jgi:hypothetical protein
MEHGRRKALAAAAVLAAAVWAVAPSPRAPWHAVFERYERRPACRAVPVRSHALVALVPSLREADLGRVAAFSIDDDRAARPAGAVVAGGDYVFAGLFGKAAHHEQWRPWCAMGVCRVSINYYTAEFGAAATPHEVAVRFLDKDGAQIGGAWRATIRPPSARDAEAHSYPGLDASLDGGRIVAAVGPGRLRVVFQTRRADGGYEESAADVSGPAVVRRALPSGARYAAVFAYREDGASSSENKIELLNAEDPAYDCGR